MKLATLKDGTRDGQLIVVSRDLQTAAIAGSIAPTLQRALDDWPFYAPQLQALYDELNHGRARHAFAFDARDCMAPLPRAFQRIESLAFAHQIESAHRARGVDAPAALLAEPLLRQGASDDLLGPADDIVCADESAGIDFGAEVAVVTGDVAAGATPQEALASVRLVTLANGVALRGPTAVERAAESRGALAAGFMAEFAGGRPFHSRPATAFAAVAATPDELGEHWRDGRLCRPLAIHLNGRRFGQPDAGAGMTFHFGQLIAWAARTRRLRAGSIVGSGPAASRDAAAGCGCIAAKRDLETLERGAARTAYMKFGDTVKIEMLDDAGKSIFGAIAQSVAPADGAAGGGANAAAVAASSSAAASAGASPDAPVGEGD